MAHMADPTTTFDMGSVMKLFDAARKDDDADDDDSGDETPGAKMGPGHVGPPKKKEGKTAASVYQKKVSDPNSIWDEEEVSSAAPDDDVDPREEPLHRILYRQRVGTEDMFLGMSGKDPTSACCEEMKIEVEMPDTKREEMTLTVEDVLVDCRSPRFKLRLPLPHPVDSRSGTAQWDVDTGKLTITLPLKREYDFINFR